MPWEAHTPPPVVRLLTRALRSSSTRRERPERQLPRAPSRVQRPDFHPHAPPTSTTQSMWITQAIYTCPKALLSVRDPAVLSTPGFWFLLPQPTAMLRL